MFHFHFLVQIEKEVCLSTTKFEDFISELLNRTFQMIEQLSTETSDALIVTHQSNADDHKMGLELTSMISSIVQQCSQNIFQVYRSNSFSFRIGLCSTSIRLDDS